MQQGEERIRQLKRKKRRKTEEWKGKEEAGERGREKEGSGEERKRICTHIHVLICVYSYIHSVFWYFFREA